MRLQAVLQLRRAKYLSAHQFPAKREPMLVRHAFRQLRRFGFSVTVIVTLALGVGANLAVFQLLQGLLFSQLPVAQPAELYSLHAVKSPFDGQWFYSYSRLRAPAAGDGRPCAGDCPVGYGHRSPPSGAGHFSQEAALQMVSDQLLQVLGLAPAAGRFFLARGRCGGADGDPGGLALRVCARASLAPWAPRWWA